MQHRAVETSRAPMPLSGAPYSQAVAWDRLIFTSGTLPLDPDTQEIVSGGIAAQTEQVLQNISAVLEAAGSSLDRVVKMTVFLADYADWPAMNEIYGRLVGAMPPARSAVQVGLPAGVRVEIEAIAYKDLGSGAA